MQCVQQTLLPMSQSISPGLRVMLALAGTRLDTRNVTDHVVVGTPGKVSDEEEKMKMVVVVMVVLLCVCSYPAPLWVD